jgi:lysophospholipase L1-like esterase
MSKQILRRVAVTIAGLSILQSGVAQARTEWTNVYSASPAAYSLPADIPVQMKPMVEPKVVQGTVRATLTVVGGGQRLRIRITNEEGSDALEIGGASVAIADPATGEPEVPPRALRFSGNPGIVIPPGAPALSDALDLAIEPFQHLVVSVYVPKGAKFVGLGGGMFALAPGDQTASRTLTGETHILGRPLVSGVVVEANAQIPLIVTMGDSITDGVRAKSGALAGYPEVLAHRLAALPAGSRRIVVNAGIAGNRVLTTGWGASALTRLDRDVFRFSNVTHLLLLEGINDIGMGGAPLTQLEAPATAQQLIAGYRQIIERAHARGIKVVGGTMTPFEGAFYFTPQKEAVRVAVNQWIRTAGEFDSVVDFDAMVRDPSHPARLRVDFDSGDHLHPNDRGYRAMGEGISLDVFR